MKKLMLALALMSATAVTQAADQTAAERYNKSCVMCHASGAGGAPKTGVVADWEPRLALGMDAMVKSVDQGKGAMPPKGMCMDCSADEFKALIEYMAAAK